MSRQQNVQQQNNVTFEAMLATARHFREHGVPAGIRAFLLQQGIDTSSSAIVRAQTDGYMLGFEFGLGGLLVTQSHRFFEFELELDSSLGKLVFVHAFSEVTDAQNMSGQNRGTGKGEGALAIEVVDALNAARQ